MRNGSEPTPFQPAVRYPSPDWSRDFLSHASAGRICLLYLRHPSLPSHELDLELHDSVHSIRPDYMANYRQLDGFPAHTVATRFSFWSNLRSRMLYFAPYHLLLLYSLPLLAAFFAPLRRNRLLPLAITLVIAGTVEFAICTLTDAIDTHRHMFLFHVITETLILSLAAWALSLPSSAQ